MSSKKNTKFNLYKEQAEFMFGIPESRFHEVDEETGLIEAPSDICCYQGGQTCKKASAEWLSPTGWQTMDKLTKDDLMAVYHPEDNTIKFEHPKEVFIFPADEWYELDSRSIHQINCPNHNMYFLRNGRGEFQKMKDFYDEHNRLKYGHRGKFITTFGTSGNINIEPIDLRLQVAFQADGYIDKQSKKWKHKFHLKKERKVKRLLSLLEEAGLDYFSRKETDGYTRIGTNLKMAYKIFPKEWYMLNEDSCKIIADEVKYWDGSIDNKNNCYYTSIKENADFVQFATTVAGYKSTLYTRVRKSQASEKLCAEYRVKYQNNNITPSYEATRNKNIIKHYKAETGEKKYCPSTSTKLWVCREFGRITVTGNSGKTFVGALRGLFLALKYPGIKGFIGAATQDLIDGTTKVQYVEHLEALGLEQDVHWWYENRNTEIVLINGSRLYFRTLYNPENYKSFEFGFIEFEEGSLLDETAFIYLLGRLRQQKRPEWDDHFSRNFFIHSNPGGTRGWIYKRFINPKTKVDGYRYINAPSTANPNLPKAYIEEMLKAYSEEQIKELIEGIDVDYDNTVAFPDFNESNIRDNIKFNPDEPLILTCDFNYNPMCWYLEQYYNDCWYVLKEIVVDNVTTEQCCPYAKAAIDTFGVKRFMLMGDAHGKDRKTNGSDYGVMMKFFGDRGYQVTPRVQKANPLIKERLAVLRGLIRNAKGDRRLYVDSSCSRLIYNLEECKNNLSNGGLKNPTDKEIQKNNDLKYLIHPIDAISYPMWFYANFKTRSITN